jgi:PhnB protein
MKTARELKLAVRPVPEGYHTVTACLTVRGCARAIGFYEKAFGAKVVDRFDSPDGKLVLHAALQVGDSRLFLSDEIPGMGARSPETAGGSTGAVYLYLPDVDETFRRAVAAGGTVKSEPADMFWGDRVAGIQDPFGHLWDLATHVEDVPPDEMKRRGEAFLRENVKGRPEG